LIVLCLAELERLRQEEDELLLALAVLFSSMKHHKLRRNQRYWNKLKVRRRRGTPSAYPSRPREKERNPKDVLARFDRKDATGLNEDAFGVVLDLVNTFVNKNKLLKKKVIQGDYSVDYQLTVVLYYLRNAPKLKSLGLLFQLSYATCSRWISSYFPILCEVL